MAYGTRTQIPTRTGWWSGKMTLIAKASAAAMIAAPQSFASNPPDRGIPPMRLRSECRSSSYSSHPAKLADSVSPATPHFLSMCNKTGTISWCGTGDPHDLLRRGGTRSSLSPLRRHFLRLQLRGPLVLCTEDLGPGEAKSSVPLHQVSVCCCLPFMHGPQLD